MGDFNYREINWEVMQTSTSESRILLDIVQDNMWTQHVTKPTRLNSLLDLVITSNPDMVDEVEVVEHLGKSDHCILKWETTFLTMTEPVKPTRDYRNANYKDMKDDLQKVDWDKEFETCNTDQAWSKLKGTLHDLISDHVPLKQPKKKKTMWLTRRALRAVRRKRRAWKRYKHSKTPANGRHYNKCVHDAKKEVDKAKRDFEKKIANNIQTDPKSFYAYVRSKQKVKDTVGPLKTTEGDPISPGQDTADALNGYFTSVFTTEDADLPVMKDVFVGADEEKISDIVITEEEVLIRLQKLDPVKAPGPDGIPPSILKELSNELCKPLTKVFQLSTSESSVPEDWRVAHISPIFKKGSRASTSNYRPISLTSVVGKLLEGIIKEQITSHLDTHNLINETQHGFRKGKSCATNLLLHLEELTKQVDDGNPVDVVYLDLQKAFDKVPHQRLIAKLQAHGITGKALAWIKAWLASRRQRVTTQGALSDWTDVSSSVVQGSVLGPLCFLIYMNDLEDGVTSIISKFADDTKITRVTATDHDRDQLQDDINKMQAWADTWQMKFNTSKCAVMHVGNNNSHHEYSMGGTTLQETKEEKDLGVWIHKSLKVAKQCAEAAKKANRVLGMIKRNFIYKDKTTVLRLYKSLVRPHLDYCMQIWSPHMRKDIDLVERVQHRATKLIPNLRKLSYERRIKQCNLMTLEDRRRRGDLIQTFRIIKGIDQIPAETLFTFAANTNRPATRGHNYKLLKSHLKLDLRKYFFSQRVIDDWNHLPADAVNSTSLLSFKIKIQHFLGY